MVILCETFCSRPLCSFGFSSPSQWLFLGYLMVSETRYRGSDILKAARADSVSGIHMWPFRWMMQKRRWLRMLVLSKLSTTPKNGVGIVNEIDVTTKGWV